jgi:hypothetical protein
VTEATLRIKCPSLACRKILAVPISSRGKTVKCKSCGGMIRVPLKSSGSASTTPSEADQKPAQDAA